MSMQKLTHGYPALFSAVLLAMSYGSSGAQTQYYGPDCYYPAPATQLGQMEFADFNEDGVLDIAIAKRFEHKIAILLGEESSPGVPKGSFGPETELTVVGNPIAVLVADFDGDGHQDIATSNQLPFQITFLYGNGDGTFSAPTYYYSSPSSSSIEAGDFNGDGRIDLAISDSTTGNSKVHFHFQNTNGTFTFNQSVFFGDRTGYDQLIIHDLDGDGDLDVITGSSNGSKVVVMLNDGTGQFAVSANYPAGWFGLVGLTGRDVNNDSILDLVATSNNSHAYTVWLGNADGTFTRLTPQVVPGWFYPAGVSVEDITGNGNADLMISDYGNKLIYVLEGDGTGDFTQVEAFSHLGSPATGAPAQFIDLNGDGNRDFALQLADGQIAFQMWGLDNPCLPNSNPDCSLAAISPRGANASCQATISGSDVTGVFDPDGDQLVVTVSPTTLSLGTNLVLITATDNNGGVCSVEINVDVAGGSGGFAGRVVSGVNGFAGVTIKLIEDATPTNVIDEMLTDASGDYVFSSVTADVLYQVMVVEPLGYTSDQNYVQSLVACGQNATIDFVLTPFLVSNNARSKGYWKHQFDVYVKNRGNAQESEEDLLLFIETVRDRFTDPHYQTIFAGMADGTDDFEEWQAVLSVKGNAGMEAKATAQLAALALNVMSEKIGQYEIVTTDFRTAGDVLIYASDLLTDTDPLNDEIAKDIAESVNNQESIGGGIVPEGFIILAPTDPDFDSVPTETRLLGAAPNPVRFSTSIRYGLASDEPVHLSIYTSGGREVAVLVNELQQGGNYSVRWDGKNSRGQSVANGVYQLRLETGGFVQARSLVLSR